MILNGTSQEGAAMKKKIAVIGAGAAGLMAACAAADAGADVTIYEKNEKAGKKIYITGKGRCNFTNACDTADFFGNVCRNPKFLYSAVYDFDQQAMISFLEENGCRTKVERGKRAFPESDHASDVTKALTDHLRRAHAPIRLHAAVKEILTQNTPEGKKVSGVLLESGEKAAADAVILATGGRSYPSTGSTGDGYRMAEDLGLSVLPQSPSLVPLVTKEEWPLSLQGLSLKNVQVELWPLGTDPVRTDGEKKKKGKRRRPLYQGFGEMMFTHFGITGPLILTASTMCDFASSPEGYRLDLDLKPALNQEELEARITREFEAAGQKSLVHAVRPLFPERLCAVIAELFAREEHAGDTKTFVQRTAHTFNEKEIRDLAALVKKVPMTVTGTRGFPEAIITKGGIDVKEFNPSTMESRKIRGLYAAGEVLDIDAVTGGFNLQIAWSTGHLAGTSAAEETTEE